jgi:hypothetical protein
MADITITISWGGLPSLNLPQPTFAPGTPRAPNWSWGAAPGWSWGRAPLTNGAADPGELPHFTDNGTLPGFTDTGAPPQINWTSPQAFLDAVIASIAATDVTVDVVVSP